MVPLRDLILLSLAVSVPFSFGNITANGLWISLGWLCFSALAALLVWRQPGTVFKALSVLAAYLLTMSGRSVVEIVALVLSKEADGLLFLALTIVVLGGALAAVGIGLYQQQRWALWGALIVGLISLFNIALTIIALGEVSVSATSGLNIAMRGVIWGGVVVYSVYLLRNRRLLHRAI